MPRLVHQPPKYCRHKASGQAVVTLGGEDVYLGDYGSKESRENYDREVAKWLAGGRRSIPAAQPQGITFTILVAEFWNHARDYYRHPDGRTSDEAFTYREALRPAVKLYGRTPAADFGPLALKAVRAEMIRLGWCRTHINRQILRIKHVFRWGAENELVKASIYDALRAVAGLRAGKTDAKESERVKPVSEGHAAAVLDYLAPQVQAILQLQALTGMRSTEACTMRGCDIDTAAKPWKYIPASHKTQHHGHERVVDLGPQARAIVEGFLKLDAQAYLFNPADGARARRAVRSAARQTPESCGNGPARRSRQTPDDHYDATSYRRAITRACERAFPAPPELARQRVPGKGRKKKATR